jgi:protein-S-isoprenylcysteine O-methyltransferase Ste14
MESPSALAFAAIYAAGEHRGEAAPLALLALWQAHYLQRAFVYPLLARGTDRPMPLAVVAMALAFNGANAYLNARSLSHFHHYPPGWLADPRFLVGAALFVAGYATNLWADRALRRLRAPGERGYRVPRGGLYEWISCPNYFGELIEWCGFALASWSAAGALFAVFTAANLVPRAAAHHRWYRREFPDYPRARRAIIPLLY